MIIKCKLDVYLMSMMLENFANTETANILLQTLGTKSMTVKCKLDVHLMSSMFENCVLTKTAKVLLRTLETKSMHRSTTVWCTIKLIPVSPTANKQIDVYTWNILTREGTNNHLSLRYRASMSDPSCKQVTITTLDAYKWTLAVHFFIPLESVRRNPIVVRIVSTMWVFNIIIMSVVYTSINKPYNHHLSPGHRLYSNNPENIQTMPRTLDIYNSRTKLQNIASKNESAWTKLTSFQIDI